MFDKSLPVAIDKCEDYDYETVLSVIEKQFDVVLDPSLIKDKKIAVKPNLLLKAKPQDCITTHPVVMKAVINALKAYSPERIVIAESPGGPFTVPALKIVYRSSGMTEVSEECGVELNYDVSYENVSYPDGNICKNFDIIRPIIDCDVIVNVCKLKTHSLTTMSCSVKNLFGTVPGVHKFEMHTRFPELDNFEDMVCDLVTMHSGGKTIVSVCDGIIGMEGNGPSGGEPKRYGCILSSLDPFSLDLAASAILGIEGRVGIVRKGIERGYTVSNSRELTIIGTPPEKIKVENLKLPESRSMRFLTDLPDIFGGRLVKFLEPRPVVDKKKCIGCGICVRSCPQKTIKLKSKNGKRYAEIDRNNCIKCFCCQELCETRAVKIKKNPIFGIVG